MALYLFSKKKNSACCDLQLLLDVILININGRPQGGWIHPQRGIRWGCSLAPLLFILAVDTLAICTHQLCTRGYLSGFQSSRSQVIIPLLQYADDTCFFMRGSVAAAHHMSSMMDIYSDFSGLRLNPSQIDDRGNQIASGGDCTDL